MWCDIGQDIHFYVIESEGEAGSVDKDRDMSAREVHNDNALTNVCVKKFNKHR